MVDPSTLQTRLEHERCWTCADTDDETQKETRLIGAVQMFSEPAANGAATRLAAFNAGLSHSMRDGSFITGDLCPSRKPARPRLAGSGQKDRAAHASGARNIRALADEAWRRFPMAERAGALRRAASAAGRDSAQLVCNQWFQLATYAT